MRFADVPLTTQTEPVLFAEHKNKTTFTDSNVHKKTRQVTETQPSTPTFATISLQHALGAIPAEDWRRTWAPTRTIMMRNTSKKVKEVV
jgi:hypothetical protein